MNERLLPTRIISGMIDVAIRNKIPVESLLSTAGIDSSLIGDDNTHLSEHQVSQVLFSLYLQLNDPAFGLHIGANLDKSIKSIAGDLFSTCTSLRQAFEKLTIYQDLIIPFVELTLEENDDYIDFCFGIAELDKLEVDMLRNSDLGLMTYLTISNELNTAGLWSTAKNFLSDEEARLIEVGYTHSAPDYLEEYEKTFACPIKFNEKKTYLRIAKDLFDQTLYGAMPDYHKKVEQQIESQLKQLKKSEAILNSVRDFIREHVSDSDLSLENAAKQLHMTGRTLQRALKMENTSFIEIRDSIRSELAKRYLEQSDVSIEEISILVGFSDASGFYTAFKRWYGVSPGSFRKTDK